MTLLKRLPKELRIELDKFIRYPQIPRPPPPPLISTTHPKLWAIPNHLNYVNLILSERFFVAPPLFHWRGPKLCYCCSLNHYELKGTNRYCHECSGHYWCHNCPVHAKMAKDYEAKGWWTD